MCVGGHRLDCLAGTTFDRSGKVSSGHLACPSIVKRFSSGQLLASTGGSVLASAEAFDTGDFGRYAAGIEVVHPRELA